MSITVIVPVYNEGKNLKQVLNEIYQVLEKDFTAFEIIIVDDYSKDASLSIAEDFSNAPEHRASLIKLDKNYGSGKAIYSGILKANYDLIIYIPADGQFDSKEIIKYAMKSEEADIVLGVRSDRHDYSLFRKLSSFIFLHSFNMLFRTAFHDVNWIHLWKKQVFNNLSIQSKGVFFLGELVAKANKRGYTIVEINSLYRPRISGTAKGGKISSILTAIKEMIKIKIELNHQ